MKYLVVSLIEIFITLNHSKEIMFAYKISFTKKYLNIKKVGTYKIQTKINEYYRR